MKKRLLVLLSLVTLVSACDMTKIGVANNANNTNKTNKTNNTKNIQTICIDNVTYVKFRNGKGYRGFGYMSVKLDTNSKIILCGVSN